MPESPPSVPTVGAIARRYGVEVHRVRYVIQSRGIEPTGRAGNARIFTDADVERIGASRAWVAIGSHAMSDESPNLPAILSRLTDALAAAERDRADEDCLVRREAIAKRLDIAPWTFDRLLSERKFPPPDVAVNAKLIRWRRSTVDRWIETGGRYEK